MTDLYARFSACLLLAVATGLGCANEVGGEDKGEGEGEATCDETGDVRCSPDEADDGVFEVCVCDDDDNCAFSRTGHCEGVCDVAAGACAENVCTGALSACNKDGTITTCNINAGGWEDAIACASGEICDPGLGSGNACVVQICTPDQVTCSDVVTVSSCNSYGTSESVVETCTDVQVCDLGACQDPCELAAEQRSFVGCLYYGADLDNRGNPGSFDSDDIDDYDIIVANVDALNSADITISRRNCGSGEWATVSGGTASLPPGGSFAFTFLSDTHLEGTGLLECGAYKIESNIPIIAYQFNAAIEAGGGTFSANASTLYPKSSLEGCIASSQYYAVSREANLNADSLVSVIGTEDNTLVSVRVAAEILEGPGVDALVAGGSDFYTVNEGDVISFASEDGDMTGTYVEGDKPIAVFGHHEGAFVIGSGDGSVTTGPDGLEEQMMPLSAWGMHFVAAPLVAPSGFITPTPTAWRILAAEDDTTVTFDAQADCSGLPVSNTATIAQQGQWIEYLTPNNSAADPCEFVIDSDKPVFVVQYSTWDAYDAGDPAMATVVPVEQWLQRYAFLAPDFFLDRIRVVRRTGSTVNINGAPVSGVWSVVDSAGEFESIAVDESAALFSASNVIDTVCTDPKSECSVALSIEGDGGACHYGYIGGLKLGCIYIPPD